MSRVGRTDYFLLPRGYRNSPYCLPSAADVLFMQNAGERMTQIEAYRLRQSSSEGQAAASGVKDQKSDMLGEAEAVKATVRCQEANH